MCRCFYSKHKTGVTLDVWMHVWANQDTPLNVCTYNVCLCVYLWEMYSVPVLVLVLSVYVCESVHGFVHVLILSVKMILQPSLISSSFSKQRKRRLVTPPPLLLLVSPFILSSTSVCLHACACVCVCVRTCKCVCVWDQRFYVKLHRKGRSQVENPWQQNAIAAQWTIFCRADLAILGFLQNSPHSQHTHTHTPIHALDDEAAGSDSKSCKRSDNRTQRHKNMYKRNCEKHVYTWM